MIPTLLYLLFKKLKRNGWRHFKTNIVSRLTSRSTMLVASILLVLLLVSVVMFAQQQVRNYKIMRKGSEIGFASVQKQADSNGTNYSMSTEVKLRFILTYESIVKETSYFRGGKLQHSYYYKKTNGSTKANRHTKLVGNNYEVDDQAKTKLNILPVTYNTLCMYFQEPLNTSKVYSDNHQTLLDIEKQPDGGYRIVSPDNTINTFYYTSGICFMVRINHSFYSAVLLLK